MLTAIAQAIYALLLKEKGNALNGMPTSFPILRIESSALPAFDIIDKQPSIIQDTGSGTATYHNPRGCEINVMDYEHFVNSLDPILQKNERRPDFIVIDKDASKFIVNELSTGNPKSKKSDAIYQMNHLVQLLKKSMIWKSIDYIPEKECVFSCREKFPATPQISPDTGKGIADSFGTIHSLMSGVVKLNFQPITKAGFALYQTDHIQF